MTQILKIRAYLMQNFMELDMKKILDPQGLTSGVQGQKTNLGQFGPKYFGEEFIKPYVQNPSCNFHKQDIIFSRINKIMNKIMKIQKISCPWGLGPRNYIWATWDQKTYQAISPEPQLQFSQTGPHFLRNHEMNPIKS